MSKITVNTFEKGMNLDASKVVQGKNTAFSIKNFRPWTDGEGQSVGGILNIEGNKKSFDIPYTANVMKFITSYPDDNTGTDSMLFSVDGTDYNLIFNVEGATNSSITADIVTQINEDATLQGLGVSAFLVGEDCIKIFSNTQGIPFDVNDGSGQLARSIYIPEQTATQIIGWTTIRDSYYIYTTEDTSIVGGPGQIWKLNLSSVDNTPTLILIYNDLLNLTDKHPIEAIGRYENECTERLYWTDNFNKVRTLLVEDEVVHCVPVDSLNVTSILTHSAPVLEEIVNGGGLTSGVYQVAYRLKTSSGAETSFSPLSRIIPIISTPEIGTNFWEYIGEDSALSTGKAMSISVKDLDTNYDTIEILTLYRKTKTDTPLITSVVQEPIPSTGEFFYTISGTESNSFSVSLDEFLLANRSFTHAKTLTSKDNRLFVGNTTYEGIKFDYTQFDPRAYSHTLNSTTFNIDGNAETVFTGINEEANGINDDYDVNKFKAGTSLYGGTGSFISYEIKTKQITADNKEITTASGTADSLPIRSVIDINPNPITLGENRDYPQPSLWQGVKNPYTYDINKGYQRDEIYRFAIVFYD